MKISSESDIIPYLEQVIKSHPIFLINKERAILLALSYVESSFQKIEMFPEIFESQMIYQRSRKSQDVIKYSLFHIISNMQLKIKDNNKKNLFDEDLFDLYGKYQALHDSLQGLKINELKCRIDKEHKIIYFNSSSTASINRLREDKKVQKRDKKASGIKNDRIINEKTFELFPVYDRLEYNRKLKKLKYNLTGENIKKAYELILLTEPYKLFGPRMVKNLDLGPYTINEYRLFWRYMAAVTLLHSLAYKKAEEQQLGQSNISSLIIIKKDKLVEVMCLNSGLHESNVLEIIKDLTYDPINVKWTEPQYQPLIPLTNDKLCISPLLVLSNNYERNYASLIEKLDWRKDVQIKLKDSHENDMISRIIEGVNDLGLKHKPRVKLKERGNEVSDIDLVIWAEECETILLISLKWFYGPDSVQEVANHAERYREANRQQRRIINFVNEHPSQVLQKCCITNKSLTNIKFLPIIVYEDDMPLEQDRDKYLPATTINRFIKVLTQKHNRLLESYKKIEKEYLSYPSVNYEIDTIENIFGDYKFILEVIRLK